jgi:hypothetical protein
MNETGLLTFEAAEKLVFEFEGLLQAQGITIAPGSELSRGCELLMELKERHKNPRDEPWATLRADLQLAVGTLQIVRHVIRSRASTGFQQLVPHLKLLSEGSVAQNVASDREDDVSNKILELLVACGLVDRVTDLELDDPVKSSGGRNPDVLCRFDGPTWGFACKAIHGDAPMTLFGNLEKGVNQIEASAAETGIVVFNFKNRLPHAEIFPGLSEGKDPVLFAYRDVDAAVWKLQTWVRKRFEAMVAEVTPDELWKFLRPKKALPGALVVVETGVGAVTDKGPLPTLLGFLQLIPLVFSPLSLPDPFAGKPMGCLRQLNDGLQLVDRRSPLIVLG